MNYPRIASHDMSARVALYLQEQRDQPRPYDYILDRVPIDEQDTVRTFIDLVAEFAYKQGAYDERVAFQQARLDELDRDIASRNAPATKRSEQA